MSPQRLGYFGLLLVLLIIFIAFAQAKPLAVATQGNIQVFLTDEPCTLEAVANLPNRATWKEGPKEFDGCFTVNGPVVVAYFSDRTVVVIPVADLKAATAI